MAKESKSKRTYPWKTKIKGEEVILRLMTSDDREAMLEFARALPEDDLLFLAVDITDESAVDDWIRRLNEGIIHTILVEKDGKLVGHGSLLHEEQVWTRHLGGIILLLAPEVRGKGLGHILAGELFRHAEDLGLQKIVARMAADQKSAVQVFEKLGFNAEALLTDCVIDRNDRTHDLIIMSYDVTGFNE
ncbi:MAG: N-acetyltransferase [Acidobacteria bacterium]|nr:MAG: N-acetyltransferase [Acidobacteriota bacterium]REJ98996.1 MAG: N-acetyltransferase [Acidobacteriota bacterium]REK16284.1 MAG: N-acetyltransferase [Acidobacteriota bacterium]REK43965.1 MAG: N-acetyltransferase [Acidobacteriota bacterium]